MRPLVTSQTSEVPPLCQSVAFAAGGQSAHPTIPIPRAATNTPPIPAAKVEDGSAAHERRERARNGRKVFISCVWRFSWVFSRDSCSPPPLPACPSPAPPPTPRPYPQQRSRTGVLPTKGAKGREKGGRSSFRVPHLDARSCPPKARKDAKREEGLHFVFLTSMPGVAHERRERARKGRMVFISCSSPRCPELPTKGAKEREKGRMVFISCVWRFSWVP
jgi:hypothetical protein